MIAIIKAAKKHSVSLYAKAAIVAAVLAAAGAAYAMSMPDNCEQSLDQCSLKVWTHDSFPHRGAQQTITFSNGRTLSCISNGANKPRSCTLTDAQQASSAGALPSGQIPYPQASGSPEECARVRQELADLKTAPDLLQTGVGRNRNYLSQAMQMTPDQLDDEIKALKREIEANKHYVIPWIQEGALRQNWVRSQELDFLIDLRANQLRGAEFGAKTPAQMQNRANSIVNDQQNWADGQQQMFQRAIQSASDELARDCSAFNVSPSK